LAAGSPDFEQAWLPMSGCRGQMRFQSPDFEGRTTMQAKILGLILLAAGTSAALAEDMKMPVNASQLKWGPAPDALPKGAQIAVLSGDPTADGPYVLRIRLPSGYKIPAHNHPTSEMVTVLNGQFHIGMGDKLDQKKGILLTNGGFGEAPAKMNHYAWTTSPTLLQIHGQGPVAITYVNPADDPRSKPQASR
jgi:hypothetical protein